MFIRFQSFLLVAEEKFAKRKLSLSKLKLFGNLGAVLSNVDEKLASVSILHDLPLFVKGCTRSCQPTYHLFFNFINNFVPNFRLTPATTITILIIFKLPRSYL